MEKSKLVKTDLMSWIKDKWAHNPMRHRASASGWRKPVGSASMN